MKHQRLTEEENKLIAALIRTNERLENTYGSTKERYYQIRKNDETLNCINDLLRDTSYDRLNEAKEVINEDIPANILESENLIEELKSEYA